MCTTSNQLLVLYASLIMLCLSTGLFGQTEQQTKAEYCQPIYTNGCAGNNGLSLVQINNVLMSLNSGCSVSGYGQFTTSSAQLTPGQTNTFNITLLDPNRPHGITIWADLNRNTTLDIGEDLYLSNGPLTGTISGTFTVPVTTPGGPLRVRVLSAYNTMPFWPCSMQNGALVPYDTGEAEDYTVDVLSPITSLTTTNITHQSAQLSWVSSATGVTYDVQYRVQGSPFWNTWISGSTQYSLLNLSGYKTYEWRVRQYGATEYYGPVSFTTPCSPPNNFSFPNPTRTMVRLAWSPPFDYPFTLRYRVAGTTDWSTSPNITLSLSSTVSSYYSVTGLTPTTAYEYQVQRNCSPSDNSEYSGVGSFTTLSCSGLAPPYTFVAPYVQNLRSNSVSLNWGGYWEPGQTFQVQYRSVGSATWLTIDSITANSYSLSGITTNIPYEWQVQRICSPTESSGFVAGPTFTLACPLPIRLNSTPTATGTSLRWQIDPTEPNKLYDIQYRIQDTADWTTLNSLSVLSFSGDAGHTLMGLARNTAYEWRIRSICPTGVRSDYTDVLSFTTTCASPPRGENEMIGSLSAFVAWYGPPVDATTYHELRYRPIGMPDWTTVGNLTQGSYLMTGLTNDTVYEWQVRAVCSPTESGSFTPPVSFTTGCRAPGAYNVFSGVVARISSATLAWSRPGADVLYEVYYQPVGSANWFIVSNIPPSSISYFDNNTLLVTNLQSATPYEWKVRTLCGNGVVSDFSNVASFTTLSCISPFPFQTASDNSAALRWNFYNGTADTRFELRWRAVGAPDWITVGNLTTNNNAGLYSLTGLTPSTAYEWQIRTICSVAESSTFSALSTFQTIAPCPSMYTVRHGSWSDPSTWSCNRIPLPTDVVQIRHNVFFYNNEVGSALRVQFEPGGKIYYYGNARLRLGL